MKYGEIFSHQAKYGKANNGINITDNRHMSKKNSWFQNA